MRTIKNSLFKRLVKQAEEADVQGLTRVANSITDQIEKHSSNVRNDDEFYSYTESDFKKEVLANLWNVMIRTADFYGASHFDSPEIQEILESSAENLINELRIKLGVKHGVGHYEEPVLGEQNQVVSIEVNEDDSE